MSAVQSENNFETENIKRLGVLGGTFNPIHNGHINMARCFLERFGLDRVLLIPVWTPPHKSASDVVPAADRIEMCRLASKVDSRFSVSDIEIRRGGLSYTVDTLRQLRNIYPNARLYLITGSDMFLTLDKWKNFTEIVQLAELCACSRSTGQLTRLREYAKMLKDLYGAKCHVEDFPVVEVSSTQVRRLLQSGGNVSDLVPPAVLEYIKKQNLYGSEKTQRGENSMTESHNDKIERFRAILKDRLSEKRFYHSCMVSKEAVKLAERYGCDVEKAEFAGLVHDIEKDKPTNEQLQTIEKYSIILDDVEKAAPKLLHAISGAAVLQYEHNVTDADILNAVRYHTTARAGMSLLEKIIYLADYISADRDYDGVEELRKAVYSSLEKGMDEALSFSINELLEKGAPIHIDTVKARNELILAKKAGN